MPRPSFPTTLLYTLLPLATIGLWVQSHAAPRMTYFWNVNHLSFSSTEGKAYLTYLGPPAPGTMRNGGAGGSIVTKIVGNIRFAGLTSIDYYPNAKTLRRGWTLNLSYPILLPFTLAFTALAFLSERKRRERALRLHHGLCPTCGYDLRAAPNQCPECGPSKLTQPPSPF